MSEKDRQTTAALILGHYCAAVIFVFCAIIFSNWFCLGAGFACLYVISLLLRSQEV